MREISPTAKIVVDSKVAITHYSAVVRLTEARRAEIRKQYRIWRASVGKNGLTQEATETAARKHYPEFRAGAYWKIEHGLDFGTPSERKALAKVFKVNEADLPAEHVEAKAS